MKHLQEYLKEHLKHSSKPLLEMARIDEPKNPVLQNYEIWIYGNDRTKMYPHFHILNKKTRLNIEVRITDLEVINSSPRKGIAQNKLKSWEGLLTLRDALIEWLKKSDSVTGINNYALVVFSWNSNNREGTQLSIKDCVKLDNTQSKEINKTNNSSTKNK